MSDELAAARRARLQAAMARRGIGAVLLATPHLGVFASGARRVQVAGSGGTVPWVVVRAGGGPPVVFTPDPDGAAGCMAEPLRWDRERQLDRLAALVREVPGAVACDVVVPGLAARLGREPQDAGPLLAEATAPRTAAEVAAIAAAVRAARAGLRAARDAAAPGASIGALLAAFADAMPAAGAGVPLGEGICWRAGVRLSAADVVEADDVVALEVGLWLDGHAGVAGATIAVDGRPLAAERRAWSTALCALAAVCRAGETTARLRAAAAAAGADQLGLFAHGLGVGVEPPWIDLTADDVVTLRPGTVLVLAPVVGPVRATRALVVTEGAARWLEPAP